MNAPQMNTTFTVDIEKYDEITLQLSKLHAQVDVLAMLSCEGDLDSLKEGSLPTALIDIEIRVSEIRNLAADLRK